MNLRTSSSRSGFSLLELLVVISIILIIAGFVVPAFNTLGRSSRLTTAATALTDELNLSRQTALARNRVVEVRFYSLRDSVDPTMAYRAMRTYISDEAGNQFSPLGTLKRLPAGIVALDDEKFSTLLNDETRPRRAEDVEDLPNAPATPFKAIRFRPTGGVELPAYTSTNDNWFLTIKNETDRAQGDRPADNFATIQIDPMTGLTRQFRP